MATLLKDHFDAAVVRSIAADVRAVHRHFDADAFTRDATKGLTKLELTARGSHVADALQRHLPASFDAAAEVLVRSLRPEGAMSGMAVVPLHAACGVRGSLRARALRDVDARAVRAAGGSSRWHRCGSPTRR